MRAIITDFLFALGSSATLSILFKATIVLMLGLGLAAIAAQARASLRHLIFATTFALLLALPLVVTSGPSLAIEVPVADSAAGIPTSASTIAVSSTAAQQSAPAVANAAESFSGISLPSLLPTVLLAIWVGGAFLLIASMLIDLMKVRNLRRHGLPSQSLADLTRTLAREGGVRRRVDVLLHEGVPAPFTCGWLRPAVILPADASRWSDVELQRALVHELEHVRRGDWPSQIAARAACAFYWFHPLVWMVWRKLCLEAERACDDAVVEKAETTMYAEQLVELSQRMSGGGSQPVLGMAKRSDLATRVAALLDGDQRRGRAGLAAAACSGIVGGFILASFGPLTAVAQTQPTAVERQSDEKKVLVERAIKDERGPGSRLNRILIEAADDGDADEVVRMLEAGADVNAVIQGDGTPLIAASRNGHIKIVRMLLTRGADVNLGVEGDGNPLIMAAREGYLEIVELLLEGGADVNRIVPSDENALIQASGEGHIEVIKLLIAKGADVNARVFVERNGPDRITEERSPLTMARKGGHSEVVKLLVSAGAR